MEADGIVSRRRRNAARAAAVVLCAAAAWPSFAAAMRRVATDFGADPTGGGDSTAAIQKCIDSVAAAGGGTVVVPPGEYRINFLSLRPHVRLELAGGAARATDGWTPAARARAMDPKRSAIVRSVRERRNGKGFRQCSIFLFNLVPPSDVRKGFGDITVSGGVFDCEGRCKLAAFGCGKNIRFENVVVKDLPNDHALQLNGCETVLVSNCLFAGYTFGGGRTALTRETIQLEQTSPYAITGNDAPGSPITCPKKVAIPNRNVTVKGCWFGPSERLGPHLVPVGHHGTPRSCNGLVFSGNVVVDPLYCALRLANVSDVTVEDNTFISTNASERLAKDSAIMCLWGGAALRKGEKGVVVRKNKVRIGKGSPLRRVWTAKPRAHEVKVEKGGL